MQSVSRRVDLVAARVARGVSSEQCANSFHVRTGSALWFCEGSNAGIECLLVSY